MDTIHEYRFLRALVSSDARYLPVAMKSFNTTGSDIWASLDRGAVALDRNVRRLLDRLRVEITIEVGWDDRSVSVAAIDGDFTQRGTCKSPLAQQSRM